MMDPSRLLAMLSAHAREHGDHLCHWLPERSITYRRLWSRIERASARLQGEWHVQSGQTVAYIGRSHPDIVVLYAALIRIGASFMPLEDMEMQSALSFIKQADASLVVVDEGVTVNDRPTQFLPQLLADWCHCDPVITEENPSDKLLLLASASGGIDYLSLNELCVNLPSHAASQWLIGPVFTRESLINSVLPSLRDFQRLYFSAIERAASDNESHG